MYLAEGGAELPADRVTEVKAEIQRLNGLVGMVVLRGGPAGAEVLVDKESKGLTPLDGPLFVDLGRHEVSVDHGGRRIFERVVTLAGGEKVVLDLAPTPTLPREGRETGADAGASTGSTPSTGSTDSAPDSAPRVWTWVAAGVGGAAAVAAAITGGVVLSRADDIEGECDGNDCPPSVESDIDGARALGTATNVDNDFYPRQARGNQGGGLANQFRPLVSSRRSFLLSA